MAPVAPHLIKSLRRGTRMAAWRAPVVPTDREFAVYRQAQRRAIRDDIAFDLTPDEFALLLCRANGRCEETLLPFEDREVDGYRYRPFWMSLDRLSNRSGYSIGNLRVVHAIVNLARGQATLQQMWISKLLSLVAAGIDVNHPSIMTRGPRPEDWAF